MKTRNNKYILYLVLGVILGIAYTACKDITPEQQRIENKVELKLSK